MSDPLWLTPAQVSDIFAEEIAAHRGTVTDTFKDDGSEGNRLFARAVLSPTTEVRPGDRIRGGVAIRATDADVFVHPYVFRLVCTNGAIMAQSTQTRHIARDDWFVRADAEEDLTATIRAAVQRCCEPAAFTTAVSQIRSSQECAVDLILTMASFLTRQGANLPEAVVTEIFRRYDRAAEASAYGLMNAVTSVARDTRDPELRWRLEELGGGVPAMLRKPVAEPSTHRRAPATALVEVA